MNFNYTGGRREEVGVNGNMSYNPATGANNPFTNVALRPFPDWGIVNFEWLAGWSRYYGTDFTLTKRYSDNWMLTEAIRLPTSRTRRHSVSSGSSGATGSSTTVRSVFRWPPTWAASTPMPPAISVTV